MRKSSSWGYKVNYDREIADDEKLIAQCTLHLEQGWTADRYPGWKPGAFVVSLVDLVLGVEGVAATLGLSTDDVRDLRWFATDAGCNGDAAEGAYWWGECLHKQLDLLAPHWLAWTSEELSRCLRKAKDNLTRHRRNKAKYGVAK